MSLRLKTLESKNKTLTEEIASLINVNENLTSDKDIKKKIIDRMQNHILSLENVCIHCNIIFFHFQLNLYIIFRKLKKIHNYSKIKITIMKHLINSKYVKKLLLFYIFKY